MIEDRDYMRPPAYERRLSLTVTLIILNAIIFIVQFLASHFERAGEIEYQYFALSLEGLQHGFLWQLLTFQFMHAGLWHLVFNSLAIYFFGRPVETVLGRSRFLTLYFASGIIGGLVQMLFAWLAQGLFGGPVVGASAGASGLIAAFAILNWEERFTLLIYFIPVTMRGRTLLAVSIAMALIGMFIPNSGIANAAHLGGILAGGFYVRLFVQGQWQWPRWQLFARRQGRSTNRISVWHPGEQPADGGSTDELLKNEVDPILEKISAQGIQSLTAREREVLEKARAKMTRR